MGQKGQHCFVSHWSWIAGEWGRYQHIALVGDGLESSQLRGYTPESCKEALVQEEYLQLCMVLLLLSFLQPLQFPVNGNAGALPSTSATGTDFSPKVFSSYFPHPTSARQD